MATLLNGMPREDLEATLGGIFKQADKDGSGSISFDEFCAAVDAFDQAEQDGQGALNALLPE